MYCLEFGFWFGAGMRHVFHSTLTFDLGFRSSTMVWKTLAWF